MRLLVGAGIRFSGGVLGVGGGRGAVERAGDGPAEEGGQGGPARGGTGERTDEAVELGRVHRSLPQEL